MVQSGSIIEIYQYEKGYIRDYVKFDSEGSLGRKSDFKSENYDIHREQVLKRAKRDLRRLINSNIGQYGNDVTTKFLTLTFSDNLTDLTKANYEFTKFIKRLNYLVFDTKKSMLKYTVVIEFQRRGAVHYHIIIYNMPYVRQKVIQETWKNGHIWINKIENVTNVGAYVAEYLGDAEKQQGKNKEDSRLEGRKSYFSSRGLLQPIEITHEKTVETIALALPSEKIIYSAEFNNEYLGDVKYTQYNLKGGENKP